MNSLPALPLENGALFIDNSGWIEGLMTCDRLVEYKQLHKRIPSGDKPALNFGSAIHLALEYRYTRYSNRPVDDLYYENVVTLLQEHYDKHPVTEDDYRNLNWAIELVRRYNAKYSFEEFNLLSYDTPVACPHCENKNEKPCLWCTCTGKQSTIVELPFAVPLFTYESTPIILMGKIDLPLLFDGQLYVMDHKTTSLLGPTFWEEKRMSSQFKGYAWAFEQATGKKVHGFAINAIRTKSPPAYVLNGTSSKSGKAQSPESWWNESLSRERFVLRPGELDEWKDNIIHLVTNFLDQHKKGFLPMKTAWCVSKYGRCSYYDVCSTHPASDRAFILSSGNFMPNDWSPLKKES